MKPCGCTHPPGPTESELAVRIAAAGIIKRHAVGMATDNAAAKAAEELDPDTVELLKLSTANGMRMRPNARGGRKRRERKPDGRRCQLCGKLLVQKGNEAFGHWKARKFCDVGCYFQHRRLYPELHRTRKT